MVLIIGLERFRPSRDYFASRRKASGNYSVAEPHSSTADTQDRVTHVRISAQPFKNINNRDVGECGLIITAFLIITFITQRILTFENEDLMNTVSNQGIRLNRGINNKVIYNHFRMQTEKILFFLDF